MFHRGDSRISGVVCSSMSFTVRILAVHVFSFSFSDCFKTLNSRFMAGLEMKTQVTGVT